MPKPREVKGVEPVPPVPAAPPPSVCTGHGCRECFLDRAAIQLHVHGVVPGKAYREAVTLWNGRTEFFRQEAKAAR